MKTNGILEEFPIKAGQKQCIVGMLVSRHQTFMPCLCRVVLDRMNFMLGGRVADSSDWQTG